MACGRWPGMERFARSTSAMRGGRTSIPRRCWSRREQSWAVHQIISISRERLPGIAKKLDHLSIAPHRTFGHMIESHCAGLLPDTAHHSGRWHHIFFNSTPGETTADPDIVHVECTRRRARIVPQRGIEEPRLNKVTRCARDHGDTFRFADLARAENFRQEPNEVAWYQRSPKAKRGIRHFGVIV